MKKTTKNTCDIVGIAADKVEALHDIARNYLKEVKITTFSKLLIHIGCTFGECTVEECISGITKLQDDKDIIIDGSIDTESLDTYGITIRYDEPIKKSGRDDSLPAYIEAVKYLRSKFPHMIIDLEPELPNSTSVTASNLIITNKKCPVCEELMYKDCNYSSTQPQYRFVCKICNHYEISRIDNSLTIGSSTTDTLSCRYSMDPDPFTTSRILGLDRK